MGCDRCGGHVSGPSDYNYLKNDTFADQIKTMNARCQFQEDLKKQSLKGDMGRKI